LEKLIASQSVREFAFVKLITKAIQEILEEFNRVLLLAGIHWLAVESPMFDEGLCIDRRKSTKEQVQKKRSEFNLPRFGWRGIQNVGSKSGIVKKLLENGVHVASGAQIAKAWEAETTLRRRIITPAISSD
jgi:hypothetical protein